LKELQQLLEKGVEYEEVVWGALKILFQFGRHDVPSDRIEIVEGEILTLKSLGVFAPLTALLIWVMEDDIPAWDYIRQVAQSGGMPLFDCLYQPGRMGVSPTAMMDSVFLKVCPVFQLKQTPPHDAAKLVITIITDANRQFYKWA
jgi:hypothetical protein